MTETEETLRVRGADYLQAAKQQLTQLRELVPFVRLVVPALEAEMHIVCPWNNGAEKRACMSGVYAVAHRAHAIAAFLVCDAWVKQAPKGTRPSDYPATLEGDPEAGEAVQVLAQSPLFTKGCMWWVAPYTRGHDARGDVPIFDATAERAMEGGEALILPPWWQ